IVDLEAFREMLHISLRVPGQSFDALPFEEEILDFLWFLGHSAQIKTLTDVNVNKLFQPLRSFAAVINKCLTGKSSGFDSLRLTAAAKGKQPARSTSPTDPLEVERTEAKQLKIVLRRSREKEEESFDPIHRTPEDSEDDGNGEEDQGLRVSEEQRLIKEEEADELYRDVDINQGQGLQVSQDSEDSHVTLTLVQPDGQQESSSMSSFVTSMLNPISDADVESIFMTASSPIAHIQTFAPIMTPSTIAPITTSIFRFEDRVKSLEVIFSEFMQTNQFAEAVSKIP
nr:hypothetical protein [Tanacetum cinerariifolium]